MNVKMCESHRAYFILLLCFSKRDTLPFALLAFLSVFPLNTLVPGTIQVPLLILQLCEVTSSLSLTGCLLACFFLPRFLDCVLLPRVTLQQKFTLSSFVTTFSHVYSL